MEAVLGARKKESERNYDRTTIPSYVLFAPGCLTGLAGQLFGVGCSSRIVIAVALEDHYVPT